MSAPDEREPDGREPDEGALARALEEAARVTRGSGASGTSTAGDGDPDADQLAERFSIDPGEASALITGLDAIEQALLGEDIALDFTEPELPEDFELLGEIGRGGMGVVYRARQRSLDREVAVKVLRPGALRSSAAFDRFRLEARSLAKLRHRHIVAIHEIGEAGGALYYSMDLIEGGSLAERLRAGPLGSAQTVRLLRQVTSAMAYSHGAGLVHRDLKPANVLFDPEGDGYVVDFGLALDIAWDHGLTSTGDLLGTPDYMSPEQARGDRARVGEASDIYGLGAILYACLTGVAPFDGLPLADKIHGVVYELPTAPGKRNPEASRDLETICLKAMAKRPEDRYVTGRAMLEDLERFEQGRSILARRPTPAQVLRRAVVRHGRELVVAGVVALLASGLLWWNVADQQARVLDRRLDDVRSLLDAGEGRAAAMMMEEAGALAQKADLDRSATVLLDHLRGRCELELAAELKRAGKPDEAREAFSRAAETLDAGVARARYSRRDGYPAIRFELLADLAIAQVELGLTKAALGTLARFQGGLVRAPQTDRLLGWMARRVADRSDTGHAAGIVILAHALDWSTPGAIGTWLAKRPALAVDIVESMLSGLDELPAGVARRVERGLLRQNSLASADLGLVVATRQNLPVTLADEIEDRLASIAADGERTQALRALATGVLVQLADLPFRLPGAPDEARFDRLTVDQLVAAWQGTRALDSRRQGLASWLSEHVDHLTDAARADALHWHETWFGSALATPGSGASFAPVREAPGAPGAPGARAELALLPTLGEVDARRLHRALERLVPAGSMSPLWPVWGDTAPVQVRQLSWRAALGPLAKDYRLSIAHFVYLEGDDTPQFAWSRQRDLAYGDRVALRVFEEDVHPVSRGRRSADWFGVRSQGLRRARPGTFVLELDGVLGLDGAGVVLDIERLDYDLSVGGVKDGWSVPRAGQTLLAGRVAPIAIQSYGWPRHGTHASVELVLAVVDSIDGTPGFDLSSIEAWRTRLAREVQRDGEQLLAVAAESPRVPDGALPADVHSTWIGELPRNLRVAIANQWILAGILALPGQRDVLRASGDALRDSGAFAALVDADAPFPRWREPGLSFERTVVHLAVARLAAGDESVLADPELRSIVENSSLTRTHWAHRVLDAPTEALRDFALARLDSQFTPDGVWVTLGRRSIEEGIQLPAWALERVERAPGNLWRESLRLADPRLWVNTFHLGISLFFLWMLSRRRLKLHDRIGLAPCGLALAFTMFGSTLQFGPLVVVMAPIAVLLAWISVTALWAALRVSSTEAPGGPDAEGGRGGWRIRGIQLGFAMALLSSLAVIMGAGDPGRWLMRLGLLLVVFGLPALLDAIMGPAGLRVRGLIPWLSRGVWWLLLPAAGLVLAAAAWGMQAGGQPLDALAGRSGLDPGTLERVLGVLIYLPIYLVVGGILAVGLLWSHRQREHEKLEQAQLANLG